MRPIIIDSHNLCYMALHTMGDLSYREMSTGVVFGFFRILLTIAKKFNSRGFVFCWDSRHSIREKHYPDYKKKRNDSRKEMSEHERAQYFSMLAQREQLRKEILPRLGFKNNFVQAGYESDDLMAYLVKANKDLDWLMVTADNDMYQCLDRCDIYNPQTKKIFTRSDFEAKYNIEPWQWAYAKAIGGCDSDGVAGVKGVADPKKETSKALKYIRGELTKGVVFDRIENAHAIINRNIGLVTLPMGGLNPMLMRLAECVHNPGEFRVFFDDYNFRSFLREFDKWQIFFS